MPETSKTADQALTVLAVVSEQSPIAPADLARIVGLNRTVVHRLLNTLRGRGFVTRTERGYAPGPVLLQMAKSVQPELRAAAAGVMARLGREIGETVILHIADDSDAVVLEQYVATPHVVRVEHEIGSRHPLTVGASGRALVAYSEASRVERLLAESGRPESLIRQLESVRQLGYAVSHDELQHGVHGLAVPVVDETGYAVASLAIITPTTRAAGISEHVDALSQAADDVAASLLVGSAAG